MKCPSCASENETGAYCTQCGVALNAACPECGAPAEPGARFCNACGEPLAASARGGGSRAPWYIAATAVTVTILILLLPDTAERAGPPSMTGGAEAGASGAGAPPTGQAPGAGLLSSDMRTNADRLFNRIMAAAQRGDEAEVSQFMPMAVQAYGMVDDLDDDGLYHLAILHRTAGQHDEARATAERVLGSNPDHILMLGVAAEAAAAAGDSADARALYQRLLDAYDGEAARPIAEYMDHNTMLARYRADARAFLDG